MRVGIRELRDGLSRHLAEVRRGHTLTVTDHGQVIARIVPAGPATPLERLIAEGRIQPARGARTMPPTPVPADGSVSDLVGDQRR